MSSQDPIAIIGMGCRFPGDIKSTEEFWQMLSEGRSAWGAIPSSRWNADAFYHPHAESKETLTAKSGYFLSQDIAAFDAKFFKIGQYEAHTMDPQQRLVLETAYEAFESAGIPLEGLRGSDTSVFVGVYGRDYDRMNYKDLAQTTKGHLSGTGEAIMSNRVSYLFDLRGASMTIDTGCSGSMVALHQACQTLKSGESRIALVGGTELLLHPDQSVVMTSHGMVNPDGRCYPFDSRGSGYSRGEGVGCVVLKLLSHAIADGDPIRAVIRNSGLNQDGRTAGISLPNPAAQSALMKSVYYDAGLNPADTLYVEAHGTGTQAGDKAEVSSIYEALCEGSTRSRPLYVGSVKANIGHLEAASGMAGLIKSVLVLEKGQIPPNIDLETPKPSLKLRERNIRIPQELIPLRAPGYQGPARVSMNSFGYGGTNCHVILESSDAYRKYYASKTNHAWHENLVGIITSNEHSRDDRETSKMPHSDDDAASDSAALSIASESTEVVHSGQQLLLLSASSESAVHSAAKNLSAWLEKKSPTLNELRDLSYTLATRRSQLDWRVAVVGNNSQELCSSLNASKASRVSPLSTIAFIFTGQGAQWYAMGQELLHESPSFRRNLYKSDRILYKLGCEWSLVAELSQTREKSRIGQSEISQPATTAIQIALVDLLADMGVMPRGVVGHSSGEIAAAYAAGALSHISALEIAYRRGLWSAQAKEKNTLKGSMLAAGAGEEEILPLIGQVTSGQIRIACVNSPESVTISGDEIAIDEIREILSSRGIFARKLQVDTAYHSNHMQKIATAYMDSLRDVHDDPLREDVAFFSSVTGTIKERNFDASYWTTNLVSQVKFSQALKGLAAHMCDGATTTNPTNIFVELGPHSALSGPVRQTLQTIPEYQFTYLSALQRNKDAVGSALGVAARLFQLGHLQNPAAAVFLERSNAKLNVVKDLMPYPWDHETKYWHESRLSRDHRFRQFPPHDLLGLFDINSNVHEPRWRHHLNVQDLPWLKDHVVDGMIIFPGSGYLCMAIEALRQLLHFRGISKPVSRYILRDILFMKPIVVDDEQPDGYTPNNEIQLVMTRSRYGDSSSWDSFKVLSYSSDGSWSENCRGSIIPEFENGFDEVEGCRELDLHNTKALDMLHKIQKASSDFWDEDIFYSNLKATGNNFGPSFRRVQQIKMGVNCGSAVVSIPDIPSLMPGHFAQPHVIHPSTLDAVNQLEAMLFKQLVINSPLMVASMGEVIVSADIMSTPGQELIIAAELTAENRSCGKGHTWVFQKNADATLMPVFEASALQIKSIGDAVDDRHNVAFGRQRGYQLRWGIDVDRLDQEQLRKYISKDLMPHHDDHQWLFKRSCQALCRYIELLSHKYPHMDILEIGCGNRDPTCVVLQALNRPGGLLCNQYDYTTLYDEHFDKAALELGELQSFVNFKTLNLKGESGFQDYESGKYDLIIAANSLSDSSNIGLTLRNARSLLKAHGRLVVLELRSAMITASAVSDSPLPDGSASTIGLNFTSSHGQLVDKYFESSFEDAAIVFEDNARLECASMIVAQVKNPTNRTTADLPKVILVGNTQSEATSWIIQGLKDEMQHIPSYESVEAAGWEALDVVDTSAIYIVTDIASRPILWNPTAETFRRLKNLFTTCRNVLWISYSDDASSSRQPMKSMITGMARVLRRENPSLRLVTLDLNDPPIAVCSNEAKTVVNILNESFGSHSNADSSGELEYALRGGELLVPRVEMDGKFNDWVGQVRGDTRLKPSLYHQDGQGFLLEVVNPGLLSSIRFTHDEALGVPLAADEIQVQARAYGVNFRDVFIALGQMLPGLPMVGEVAGIVTAVGTDMKGLYELGDRVMGIGARPFASQARLKGLRATVFPETLSFSDAASIPLVYLTAYHCLVNVAHIECGQKILIHAASGGVGQAAIQVAQYYGAEVFATVSNAAKKKLIMDRYCIPESHIFSSRMNTFKQGIQRMTNGEGVDVVLNSLAGEVLSDSWECLARLGIFIEIGKADIYKKNQLGMGTFDKSTTFVAVDILVLFEKQPQLMHRSMGIVVNMFREGTLSLLETITPLPMENIEAAFRLISTRKHTGKVVLTADEHTLIEAVQPAPKALKLHQEGSYIVVGGLGDLGRRLCRLLAQSGAGHVIAISRRKPDAEGFAQFESEVNRLGGSLHAVQCDITNLQSVKEAAELCRKTMPPIRGIIHGGMVLRDIPFERMTLHDYLTSTGPKITGTINLNEAFASPDLAFFITLSSITAILGTGGQSNYAVGNCFQDGFARAHAGLSETRYISLNLGAVDGTDAILSLPKHQQELMRRGAVMMTFEEVYKVLEYAMGSQAHMDGCIQEIFGFDRDSMISVDDKVALSNPMFSMIPYTQKSTQPGNSDKKIDIDEAIQNAKTLAEAENLIIEAIVEKFSLFLGRTAEEIPPETSLAAIGMDSLVAIELKNWMVRSFQVSIQPSEIQSAESIIALGKSLASRSKLLSNEIRSSVEEPAVKDSEPSAVVTKNDAPAESHGFNCCRCVKELPRLPIPDLDEYLHHHLQNVSHFLTPGELESFSAAIADFTKTGSIGRKLYYQLLQLSNDPSVDCWADELYIQSRHTSSRLPLMFNHFIATHHDAQFLHQQSERAAIIAATAFKFKQAVEADTLEPHWYFAVPSCMYAWQWLFNVNREPGIGMDQMKKYTGDYCVVLRKGRVFKVNLSDDTGNVSIERLEATFTAIMDHVNDSGSLAGVLTTANRDSWAKMRSSILTLGPQNIDYLRVVEESAFIICLDDKETANHQQQVTKARLHDGTNRWMDKSIQFIVSANGMSSHMVEHTRIDGLAMHRLNEWIHESINGFKRTNQQELDALSRAVDLQEYTLVTTPEIGEEMVALQELHSKMMSEKEYGYHTVPGFGKEFLLSQAAPIKGAIELAIALASRLYHGRTMPCWEPTSLSHFHKGRIDFVQQVGEPVAKFCDVIEDESVSKAEKRIIFREATEDMAASVRNSSEGKGYHRLMGFLQQMWPKDEPLPPLFNESAFERTTEIHMTVSQTDGSVHDSLYMESNPDFWWMCYNVEDHQFNISIGGRAGEVARMKDCIDKSVELVKSAIALD